MPKKFKLTYFNLRGRAELSRFLFELADQEYEDVRIEAKEEWPKLKPTSPFGQLPILEVDGQVYCQGLSISRYLAREFGFAGKTNEEQLKIDMIIECIEDLGKPLQIAFVTAKTEEEKKAAIDKYVNETQPPMLANLEKMVNDNGFFVGDSLTVADLQLFIGLSFSKAIGIYTLEADKYPKLAGVMEKCASNPKIDAWIKKRPQTAM